MLRRLLTVIVPSFALLAACGDSDGAGEKSPQAQYAGRLAHAVCASLESCCTANGLTGFDEGRCELGAAAFIAQGVDAAKARGATFDPSAADACVAGTERLARACTPAGRDQEVGEVCARVFVGPKKNGEACNDDADCAPGPGGPSACAKNDSESVCVALRRPAAVGDVCGPPRAGPIPRELADCAGSGLQCGLGSDAKCQALAAVGADCPGFTRCVAGAYCASDGTCAPTLASGAACTKSEACASGACVRGKCGQNALATVTPCTGEPA